MKAADFVMKIRTDDRVELIRSNDRKVVGVFETRAEARQYVERRLKAAPTMISRI